MSSQLEPLLKLIVPPSLDLKVSHQQFEQLATANRDLRLERTAQGKLIVNPPTGWETGKRNLSITRQLGNWYEENPEKGEACATSERGFFEAVRVAWPKAFR
ncbi:MAG: Uma2 family endonuclease [Moorea sp. SIO1G6]|uniref:Uma2 family endonuclease n=1 Tax=Moorena producens (strain JHB) TaxID=1454205 RepID=A0A1D9FZ53_MOOP1|nr:MULTISPECIES: Uma2 family endonuclease [Moorena]AOY80662.1 Uma2 family endonuclease [Moorena producens JHB]NET67583.1 Uma2 family endonuclease [Moorena sp. SIO1G6]